MGIITLTLVSHKLNYAFGILLPVAFFYLALAVKKNSLKKAFFSLVKWNIISLEIIGAFLKRPRKPEDYPKDPIVIQGEFNVKQ